MNVLRMLLKRLRWDSMTIEAVYAVRLLGAIAFPEVVHLLRCALVLVVPTLPYNSVEASTAHHREWQTSAAEKSVGRKACQLNNSHLQVHQNAFDARAGFHSRVLLLLSLIHISEPTRPY